jgi:dTDP-4-amino-4,6-dideoxygalactose transaminase
VSADRRHRDFLGVSQPAIGQAEQQEVLAVLQSGW